MTCGAAQSAYKHAQFDVALSPQSRLKVANMATFRMTALVAWHNPDNDGLRSVAAGQSTFLNLVAKPRAAPPTAAASPRFRGAISTTSA